MNNLHPFNGFKLVDRQTVVTPEGKTDHGASIAANIKRVGELGGHAADLFDGASAARAKAKEYIDNPVTNGVAGAFGFVAKDIAFDFGRFGFGIGKHLIVDTLVHGTAAGIKALNKDEPTPAPAKPE